jgi:hypothetical protein
MEEIQSIEPNRDCEICLSIMDNHADNLKDAAQDCPVHSKPTAAVIDWLLILPSAYSEESTVDMAMYLESEFPPPLIEREGKNYRLKSWDKGRKGQGTARYSMIYRTREGEIYRKWSDLKKATGKEVDAIIETWKEEFGEAIDNAMGLEGVTSMVLDGDGRELRAGGWLNRDSDGCLEQLNWNVTHTHSDKVGLRFVSVWQNSHRDSDPERAWGWEVRKGGMGLGVSGGVGMTKLVGYSDTMKEAKTDGMKALLGANQIDEAQKAESKILADAVKSMPPKAMFREVCFHGAMFNPNCPKCVETKVDDE